MKIGSYIQKKIDDFNRNYHYMGYLNSSTPELNKKWKQELRENDRKWREIKSNQDVMALIKYFNSSVSFVESYEGRGHIEDGYNMALALYNAIQGLRKMAQFIDPSPWNTTDFEELTVEDVDAIFERLESIAKRMDTQNTRRAMQD